jgi:hypothetical protein
MTSSTARLILSISTGRTEDGCVAVYVRGRRNHTTTLRDPNLIPEKASWIAELVEQVLVEAIAEAAELES